MSVDVANLNADRSPPFAALAEDVAAAPSVLRAAVSAATRRDEAACVAWLQSQRLRAAPACSTTAPSTAPPAARTDAAIAATARRLVEAVRRERTHASGVDALMHEFSLSSHEGVALMCVAEALLRIPDAATADRLIADKISKGDWRAHLGESPSLFVNAATWGLLITGKLVATSSEQSLSSAITRLIARGGEPLIRKGVDLAMRMLGNQFVSGQTIDAALANSRACVDRGYQYSYDMLGEAAVTEHDARRYLASYETAIHAIGAASAGRGIKGGPGISVKLSALHPRYSRAQRARVMTELLPRLKRLVLLAKQHAIGINIDAEEADRLELSLDLLEALAFDPELAGFDGIGFVVQAYQKRCPYVLDFLVDLSQRSGRKFMVRLVKGAYWDAEIKRAQIDGLADYPVYTRKLHTDMSYLVCARKLLMHADRLYPQFATHNAQTLAAVYHWAREEGVTDYEFQCLHGMGETLYDQVVGATQLGVACRIYAPVGSHRTLLAYLVRRLLENGANSSFVNRIVDPAVSIDALIADPFEAAQEFAGSAHPQIGLPSALYGPLRRNSAGLDFSDEPALRALAVSCDAWGRHCWQAVPMIASGVEGADPGTTDFDLRATPVRNPADHEDVVGHVIAATAADIEAALTSASTAVSAWQGTSAPERAGILRNGADLLEAARDELLVLAVREAGKTLPNAMGEVREAVDFLRYYAAQIEAEFGAEFETKTGGPVGSLGVVVCISPWNFPLAIFVGQIGAALAAGNVVLAKPAEQTPLIAARAVQLLHAAGVPRAALQLLPGSGLEVGAPLVAAEQVAAVLFTGSTAVAQSINRTLAKRSARRGIELPLIAETGGQNAMLVDSSALPEQVVQDVMASAFDSAGQRCSALRVLCLQEEIADDVLGMLKGALEQASIGRPDRLDTDIGPVIDGAAQRRLLAHIERLRWSGAPVFQMTPAPQRLQVLERGTYVLPTIIEIASLGVLREEVFGPVLHVLRYRRQDLAAIIDDLNATGYGLTLGIHSRIDETIDFIVGRAHVGNVYVNRSMVGAVVGSQPFGGEGKSGTGPKAGGPLYLQRLRQACATPVLPGAKLSTTLVPAYDELLAWALRHANGALLDALVHYAQASLLGTVLHLPGPTGEKNMLGFSPRGNVLCVAGASHSLLQQLAAAFACGNKVVLPADQTNLLPTNLPAGCLAWVKFVDAKQLDRASIDFALIESGLESEWQEKLAARNGLLIPVMQTRSDVATNIWRLFCERAVSVNTAAAGGNASLMTLSD